jgi:hypothetical protein
MNMEKNWVYAAAGWWEIGRAHTSNEAANDLVTKIYNLHGTIFH